MSINAALNPLDEIRLSKGIQSLKAYFNELVNKSTDDAINLIRDDGLHFASLFVLKTEIEKPDIFSLLDKESKVAVEFSNELLLGKQNSSFDYLPTDYVQLVHSTLRWILETGCADDGLSSEFDEILDISAAFLSKVYKDRTVLSVMIDMIFERYRKGFYIHDLIWAFFEARDPQALRYVADHLLSNNRKDYELVYKLLHFIPGIEPQYESNKEKQYLSVINWLDENSLFLRYTGQNFHQTPEPIPYDVILEAKYLHRCVSIDTGKVLKPFTEEELKIVQNFNKLNEDIKIMLSSFSFKFHNKNITSWDNWLRKPIEEQIKIASSGGAL